MKSLLLIGDGMADFPLAELDGRTPLEVAATPAMDEVARLGVTGLFCPIPNGLPPGSDIGNLSLFGYDPRKMYTGRGPIEAARHGIVLGVNEIAFRCNLVTLQDEVMASFTAGHVSTEESAELIKSVDQALSDLPAVFYPGVSYRHLTVVTAGRLSVEDLVHTECTPPHNITDQPCCEHLPKGPGSAFIVDLMERAAPVLEQHPVNVARVEGGKLPANAIWLWGQGGSPSMESYQERFGLTGAVISAVDLVKGIGVCAGLEVIDVPGATGYIDTDYEGKVHVGLDALARHDFAYVHVEAPDEASHEGKADLKIRAIEDFDRRVVAPCLEYLRTQPDTRLLVAPDHVTAISTKTHATGPVPFALCGAAVEADDATAYSEREAERGGVFIAEGHRLVPFMLGAATIDREALAGIEEE